MTNEIKEILKKIKSVSNFDDYVDFIGTEFKPLLDYITNLQEENERLKNLYTNEKSHKIDYDYIKMLYSKIDKDSVIDDLVYKSEQCRVLYDSAEKTSIENYNLQDRIDKAIEYLKSISMDKTPDYIPLKDYKEYHILLDILRGDE